MKDLKEQLEKLIEDAYDPDWEEFNTIEFIKSITYLINDNYVPKEFAIHILDVINEGYYKPEEINELFEHWKTL